MDCSRLNISLRSALASLLKELGSSLIQARMSPGSSSLMILLDSPSSPSFPSTSLALSLSFSAFYAFLSSFFYSSFFKFCGFSLSYFSSANLYFFFTFSFSIFIYILIISFFFLCRQARSHPGSVENTRCAGIRAARNGASLLVGPAAKRNAFGLASSKG